MNAKRILMLALARLMAPLRRKREREFERLLAAYRPPTEPELRMMEVAECPDPLPALRAFYSRRPRPWRPRMERRRHE